VGRPPSKADTKPDIVVNEKSVSKIHAILRVEPGSGDGDPQNRLILIDKSRFGTTVNGQKMPTGGSQELAAGDAVQLAPKTFLMWVAGRRDPGPPSGVGSAPAAPAAA
ncbi:hypothetical protein Agub_g1335, partial [Astrephomene gubernaculifera]